jgi:hypothetical protein
MFVRSEQVLWTELDGQVVLLGLQRGRYYETNALGAAIWELLDEPRSASDIVDRLVSRYRVEPKRCADDLARFLNDLQSAGLIVPAEPANSPTPPLD